MCTPIKEMHGGMVSGDTILVTDTGLKRVKDVKGPVKIWNSFDWCSVSARQTETKHHMWKVTISDGSQLMCGKNHPWGVLSGDNIRSVMTDQLKMYDNVIAVATVKGNISRVTVFNAMRLGENYRKDCTKIPPAMMNADVNSTKDYIKGWLKKHHGLVGHSKALNELSVLLSSMGVRCRIIHRCGDVFIMYVNIQDKCILGVESENLYQEFNTPRLYVYRIEELKNRQPMYVVETLSRSKIVGVGGFVSLADKPPPALVDSPIHSQDDLYTSSPEYTAITVL